MHMFHDALVSFAERRVIYMSVEVEIKLKIEDPEQLIEKLEGLGFIKGEQLLESDTYFTSENHDFVKLGEALRVRQIRNVDTDEISAVITYKGKKLDDRSMAREELELEIPDAEVWKNTSSTDWILFSAGAGKEALVFQEK